jgi:hypothetical protein
MAEMRRIICGPRVTESRGATNLMWKIEGGSLSSEKGKEKV